MLSKKEALLEYKNKDRNFLSSLFLDLSKLESENEYESFINYPQNIWNREIDVTQHAFSYEELCSYIEVFENPSEPLQQAISQAMIRPEFCSPLFFYTLYQKGYLDNPKILKNFLPVFYLNEHCLGQLFEKPSFQKNLFENMTSILKATGNFDLRDASLYKQRKKRYHQSILKQQQDNLLNTFSEQECAEFYQFLKRHSSFPNEKQILKFYNSIKQEEVSDDFLHHTLSRCIETINTKNTFKLIEAKEVIATLSNVENKRIVETIIDSNIPEYAYSINHHIIPYFFERGIIQDLVALKNIHFSTAFSSLSDTDKVKLYKNLDNPQDQNLFFDWLFDKYRINNINFFNLYKLVDFTKTTQYQQNGTHSIREFAVKQIDSFDLKEGIDRHEEELAYFFKDIKDNASVKNKIVETAFRKFLNIMQSPFGDDDFYKHTQNKFYGYIKSSFGIDMHDYNPLNYVRSRYEQPAHIWLEKQQLTKQLNESIQPSITQKTNRL